VADLAEELQRLPVLQRTEPTLFRLEQRTWSSKHSVEEVEVVADLIKDLAATTRQVAVEVAEVASQK